MIDYKNIREIGNNQGFNDKNFENKMKDIGFLKGMSWCSLFVKHIWKEFGITCANKDYKDISASVMSTFNNFKMHITTTLSSELTAGSIVIWQSKSSKNKGHTGIFIKQIDNDTIICLEGNTSEDGKREGDGVYFKQRKYKDCGFNFMGFVLANKNDAFDNFIVNNLNYFRNF